MGDGHVDDPAHRRRQADADPAAHAPAGLEDGTDDRLRDGQCLPRGAQRGAGRGCRRARAVRAGHVRVVLSRRPEGAERSERPRHHRRRPEPRGADRQDVRHRHRRSATPDRERRRVGHLVARVLPGGQGPSEPGRRDDAVDPVRSVTR